jgi:hypothetical protein
VEVHQIASVQMDRRTGDPQSRMRELKDFVRKFRRLAAVSECRATDALALHG